jgi:hypothetical protein
MSCCGEPDNKPQVLVNSPTQNHGQTINQQPGPQPSPYQEKLNPAQPNVIAPVPVQQQNVSVYGQNGLQMPALGEQTPSPPPAAQLNPYASTSRNTSYGKSPNSTQEKSTLIRPGYPFPFRTDATSPPPISNAHTQAFSLSPDEGKMSVSIDFGAKTRVWNFFLKTS